MTIGTHRVILEGRAKAIRWDGEKDSRLKASRGVEFERAAALIEGTDMAKKKSQGAKLDAYEKGILRSYERGEWKPVDNMGAEVKRYAGYAHQTLEKLRKTRRVNIRLSGPDLAGMQQRAIEEGIPYQTLMASVLHKYVTGRLVEKRA